MLWEEFEQARAVVVERLRARRAEIDDAIFARVRDLAPSTVGLADPGYVAGLRAAIAAAVDFVLEGLERDWESDRSEVCRPTPSAVVVQARRAARVGVGLDTVLRRYVAGLAVLEDFIMQEADHSALEGERTALRHVLEASASLLDRLLPSVTGAYMQELEPAGRTPVPIQIAPPETSKQSSNGGGSVKAREEVVQDQRERILRAVVQILAERGFAGATIGLVVTRARVSTRTFYELFDGLQECLIVVMDQCLGQVVALAVPELVAEECWQDGVRSALAAVLSFFDREPELARVCIVETLAGGPAVLRHREGVMAAFRLPVVERIEREVPAISPLTAEGVMSSVLGIMHAHIVEQKPGPFIELLGPMMGLATAPYLSARSVQQEIERGDDLAQAIRNGDSRWSQSAQAAQQDMEPAAAPEAIPFVNLGDASARRLRECVIFLTEHPDSSNREVGVGIDLVHQSQVSKLLTYLAREGLATKRSEGKGKRNAWRLTPQGEEIARRLMEQKER